MPGEFTKKFRELGKRGASGKEFKALYKKMKEEKDYDEEDVFDLDPRMEEVLRRYEKNGGLVRSGKPKIAKKGWR
jgi:phage regulator Rha-like protein